MREEATRSMGFSGVAARGVGVVSEGMGGLGGLPPGKIFCFSIAKQRFFFVKCFNLVWKTTFQTRKTLLLSDEKLMKK